MTESNEGRLSVAVPSGTPTDAARPNPAASGQTCPQADCLVFSPAGSKFCWRCRYNFVTGRAASLEPRVRSRIRRRIYPRAAESTLIPVKLATGMPELRREFVRVPAQDFKPSVVFTAPLSLPPEATDVTAPANREAMPLPPLHMVLQPHAQMPDLKVSDEPVLQAHGQVVEVSDDPVLAPQGKLVEEPASGPVTKATEPTAESASVDSDSSMHPWLLMQVIEDLQGDALTKLPVAAWEGIKYPLTGDAHFCGRRFKEDICLFEEDVSTSNFHGIFQRQENGSYTFMDRSSNGTAIDGIQVPKNKDTPLKNGNVLTLGGFTRITYFEPVHQPKDLTTEPDQMLTATA